MALTKTGSDSSSKTGAIWAVRQGQQNRRGRGRNNNNRKNHNPLARSFESNGPDVKIRGTPAHIAEKYLTLSRDAQSSGDPVLAENYLQHAEHYMRIIMAYREQLQQPGELPNGNGQRLREPGDIGDEFGDDEGDDMLDDGFAPQHQPPPPPQHQAPRHSGGGYDANRNDRHFRRDQGSFRNRDRDRDRDRGDRDRDRGDRDRGDRDRPMEGRPAPQDRPPPHERHQEPVDAGPEPRRDEPRRDTPEPRARDGGEPRSRDSGGERELPRRDRDSGGEPRRRDRFQQPHEQPEFLRRPVRRARSSESEESAPPPPKDDTPRD